MIKNRSSIDWWNSIDIYEFLGNTNIWDIWKMFKKDFSSILQKEIEVFTYYNYVN